jgi:hypothetical protein
MGNFTTRINWEPRNDNNLLFEHINTICEVYEMEKITWENGINVIGEDKILEDNSVILRMHKCIDDIKSYLNSENVSYNCEDTKV